MRIIIIGFALAMVIIGIYPFRREFRTQFREVRAFVRRELGDYSSSLNAKGPGGSQDARAAMRRSESEEGDVRDRDGAARRSRSSASGVSRESGQGDPAKNLDRLSEDDRRALDKLLNR